MALTRSSRSDSVSSLSTTTSATSYKTKSTMTTTHTRVRLSTGIANLYIIVQLYHQSVYVVIIAFRLRFYVLQSTCFMLLHQSIYNSMMC